MEELPSVSVSNVSKTFTVLSSRVKVRVLDDISFTCKPGDLILLTGKNGSGKSTLLRLIANIVKPSKGSIKTKGRIGYYPQNPQFNKGVSVLDFTNYIGALKTPNFDKKNALLWLQNFGIPEKWFNIDILLLSEGMKRRVALSLSFLGDPNIILLDEPLENLDRSTKDNFMKILSEELQGHKTIIVATHETDAFLPLNPLQINLEMGKTT